ncbi:hypothetical protein AMS68_004355 [Peltaster fructicola]|uniref:histidine kinase n=1 Tax=Peltaster fructicola TaxID=286661 RepID=A0A6H0XW63_9PEZI|nr:hypothetical protein AMS68_004355 [Peltaster fructicola]
MSSSRRPHERSDPEYEDDSASADDLAPSDVESPATARPQLVRLPPKRTVSETQTRDFASPQRRPSQDKSSAHAQRTPTAKSPNPGSVLRSRQTTDTAVNEEEVARLRDAVNARLALQPRARGTPSPSTTSAFETQRPLLPSHASSNVSTLTEVTTSSTESTESAKTIRGSVPATPIAATTARTPSYPFPYVASSVPRSSAVHQPFTTLSPTASYRLDERTRTARLPSLSSLSEISTPIATSNDFLPTSAGGTLLEDPRFPTPNLYNLILELSSEPGLDAWWSTVTRIMHEQFKAERATLAMPADPTDIENVPWGQKATFSMNGPEEFVSRRTLLEQTLRSTLPTSQGFEVDDVKPRKLHPERLRPQLELRHSYAGPIQHVREHLAETSSKAPMRPKGPQRVVTHASGLPGGVGPGRPTPKHGESFGSIRHTSITDPDFSSVAGGVDAGPNNEIFATLRALDHEAHPLIEISGIHRVLERGRVVTVTRDYGPDSSDSNASQDANTPTTHPRKISLDSTKLLPLPENSFAGTTQHREYDEYEQMPCSPWAQSPAPSPAIQADEERNPFFPSDEQNLEDSFNPVSTPKDYSTMDQVEAIGIDRASTVLHIPLIHPILSQPMQSLRMKPVDKPGEPQLKRSNTIDNDRKAPIAILSILTSTVPYPANLTASLKLFGPHLATSLALAQQFAYTNSQIANVRRLRSISGQIPTDLALGLGAMTLDDIVNAGLDELPTSLTGSITSPSEYSGRSKHSPLSSPLGTPNWEHGSQQPQQWSRGPRSAGTPAMTGSASIDYFAAKDIEDASTPARVNVASSAPLRQQTIQEDEIGPHEKDDTPRGEGVAPPASTGRSSGSSKDGERPVRGMSRTLSAQMPDERRHSVLHSYGADYQASFGSPAVSTEDKRLQALGQARAHTQAQDMPPPSERLLRTIIDSLPVQVFTAAPDTGNVTWVNSKFLIYRGQDSRQVLGDPWQAIHPDDRKEYMETWQRCLKTGQQLQQKVRLQRFDSSYRWFYVRAAPLKDKRQQTVHWIGTNMDFHEQHIAEQNSARQQETEASEAKYRALANSSPQIVFAVNRSSGVIFCNTQWMSYSGQSEARALGAGFMDHVHPDDLSKCRLPMFDDGSEQPTNVPTSLPFEPKRTTTSASAQSSDGSSTEKASSDDSVVSPILNLPQRKLSELATTGILKVSRDQDGRQSYSTEVRLKSKDDEYRWHLVRVLLAKPTSRARGEEETWYGTCTDINDHKTLERDLKETMDEKSRFLSNMSHEIRTPLNGITGMVNFLIDSNLTAEQMEHVNIIRASTEGLRGLINDILDLSKAEAGMIQLNVDWMYVRDLIEEVNDLTSTMAIDKGLELNYLVEATVPAQIKGDRFRIRQILLNIVGNAIKFTQTGEVFIRCSVMKDGRTTPSKSEISIRFDITDTGQGFTEKEAEALFKRFSQIDGSSTRQHGGTGLGLVISRQLAQLHGGDMSARGSPGKGSTFTFYIVTSLPTRDDQPPTAPPPTPAVAMPVLRKTDSASSGRSKFAPGVPMMSPVNITPDVGIESAEASSASSDPSIRSGVTSSIKSTRSSMSSAEHNLPMPTNMKLTLPSITRTSSSGSTSSGKAQQGLALAKQSSGDSAVSIGSTDAPLMFSIMVVAPLKYSREATVEHIDKTLPKNIPHSITACGGLEEFATYLRRSEPVIFTHVVVVLQDVDEIITLVQQILSSFALAAKTLVIITDLAQRRKIVDKTPNLDYKELESSQRLVFVFKPLKPSRFGAIFDPHMEREMSADRAQDSAQQVALSQKQVFEQLTKRLGNRDKRVLLVEDNKVNQMVILKFFGKVAIRVETVMDGVQCTDKVFSHPHGYYSIILCDLHMPNKDGYQTCKEIRKWEKKNKHKHLPIIALSANVLGDVYQKCVDAGFNSYITKPVDFKELSTVLMAFMDPADPNKPHEFMKLKGKPGGKARA